MPNTEVKLLNVDDTWWATARESRSSPDKVIRYSEKSEYLITKPHILISLTWVRNNRYSSLAQSVEHSAVNRVVVGSSPTGGVFRLLGQAVKTSPFHGGNTGSIPVGVILNRVGRCGSIGRAADL